MDLKKTKKYIAIFLIALIFTLAAVLPVSAAPSGKEIKAGNGQTVKNVIVLISDGWGYNQILATDYYTNGKANTQKYEKFPTKIAMSTYSYGQKDPADNHLSFYDPGVFWNDFNTAKLYPTDSAAAGTAMATGTKTYDAAIGVDENEKTLANVVEDFEKMGRSTGVISSVQFSHATPASFVAHHGSRNDYSILANQMLKNSATDVIMGAGHPYYDVNGNLKTEKFDFKYVGGEETWTQLKNGSLSVADADGDGQADAWKLIETKDEFAKLENGSTADRVVGVAQVATTLQQARSGDASIAYQAKMIETVPTLESMTKGALNVLDNNEEGFFLMIEGGAIDWAGHANQSGRLIEEQIDFNNSVNTVCKWVEENSNWGETLVIVTGDHETGYLTGTAGTYDKVANNGKGHMPTMAWNSTDHTNQLIPLFAKGQGAELFKKAADLQDPIRGKYMDNTDLPKIIRALID